MTWKPGERLIHRFNPELGTGVVRAVEDRTLVVEFPTSGTVLRIAANSDAIGRLTWRPGTLARLAETGETVLFESLVAPTEARLADGRTVPEADLWPIDVGDSLVDRLAQGDLDPLDDFSLRLDSLRLAEVREADGLGSFLGGRIRLFPHQFHVAERATRAEPVRWLLADEVGLGKTVEAGLVVNRLVRSGRADRTLVVVPETLTVQWLGELWRKYHQVFVLLDDKRLADVDKDYGRGFSPFDAHPQTVLALEMLCDNPRLTEQAVEAGVDLLIVDEAHRLRRPPGHPGDQAYRAIRPIADLGRHVLLLTATPLEDDAHGFFRLLQLLRPEEFPEDLDFEERLLRGDRLPPCTSATRREDVGGLPPRRGVRVELPDGEGWVLQLELEAAMRALPAPHEVARRAKARKIRRAQASGVAVEGLLGPADETLRALARRAMRKDPRLAWLADRAVRWKANGDKTLVFVAHRETLEAIRTAMRRQAQTRVGVFHEDLSTGQRDIEVAQFRLPSGPSMLVSTECGGEGRNFEFCTRLVLFDLPWNPMTVEQRIGRLDRIGRNLPVEIVYFRPPSGIGAAVADLFESLGLFRSPLGGLERELSGVDAAIRELALSDEAEPSAACFDGIVHEAREAFDRVRQAAYHELHREPYRSEMSEGILARIPDGLDDLTEDVVLGACERLGMNVEPHRDGTRHSIEFNRHAEVDSLPGIPGDAAFLGTFQREEAVRDETIDFFASGHPLVEGILAHLDENPRGRVTLLHLSGGSGKEELGLLAIYRKAVGHEAVAVDAQGRERPEWAALATRRPLRTKRLNSEGWTEQPGWPDLIRGLARPLENRGQPDVLAVLHITP